MEASSFQEADDQYNINNASLNETANSIHFEYGEKDKDMLEINDILRNFIEDKLETKIEFVFRSLEEEPIFAKQDFELIKPIPNLFFLPTTLLFTSQRMDIDGIKKQLQYLQREDYQIRYKREKKEINIIVHNHLQMLFYNLRVLKTDSTLHRDPKMLDSRYLTDKLFEYYSKFYTKLYFRQTSILILYWAYQHQLLEHTISEQALKLIIICNFINFGYGVNNICQVESNNQYKLKMNKKMNSFLKINSKGQTQVLPGLQQQFSNYTIQEKRGFYMVSKKKFMQIKDIVPVFFPILPLEQQQHKRLTIAVQKSIKGPIEHTTQMMSICKNISKIFRFLHNKFQKPMRLVVDFGESSAYRSEFSSHFELQVMHPVLHSSVCRLKDGEIKQLSREINTVYNKFTKNQDPLEIMMFMLERVR